MNICGKNVLKMWKVLCNILHRYYINASCILRCLNWETWTLTGTVYNAWAHIRHGHYTGLVNPPNACIDLVSLFPRWLEILFAPEPFFLPLTILNTSIGKRWESFWCIHVFHTFSTHFHMSRCFERLEFQASDESPAAAGTGVRSTELICFLSRSQKEHLFFSLGMIIWHDVYLQWCCLWPWRIIVDGTHSSRLHQLQSNVRIHTVEGGMVGEGWCWSQFQASCTVYQVELEHKCMNTTEHDISW